MSSLPTPDGMARAEWIDDVRTHLIAAHRLWMRPTERRRVRAFGFRPAVEHGVLKREWRGLNVRLGETFLRAARPGVGELSLDTAAGQLQLDGGPLTPTPAGTRLTAEVLDLIADYERWVEAREGRDERIARGRRAASDGVRHYNALAETRRLQRLLAPPSRRSRR